MRKALTIILALLLISVTMLMAQRDDSEQRSHIPKPPVFKALDANNDDIISESELADAPSALKSLDKNADGQLTPDEMRPEGMKEPEKPDYYDNAQKAQMNNGRTEEQKKMRGDRPRMPRPPLIEALDTDKDGKISSDEIKNATASLKKLDRDGNGKLTHDEISKHPRPEDNGRMNSGRKVN
jgi:Ca2+-binding EF-hand superfamily protein